MKRKCLFAFVAGAVVLAAVAAAADDPPRRAALQARIAAKLDQLESYQGRPAARAAIGRVAPALRATPNAATSAVPTSETLIVDCSKGKSVSEAIAESKARHLRVEVSGTCAETVVVERVGVTISGTAAGGATIDPPEVGGVPTGPAIRALGAHELTLEDLVLTGGLNGLDAVASRQMRLTRISAVSNPGSVVFEEGYGVRLEASEASITDSDLSANGGTGGGGPILAAFASQVIVTGSTMTDNPFDGPFSFFHSDLRIIDCDLSGNGFGPQAVINSFTRVNASTVDGAGSNGSFADGNSLLEFQDSTLTNMADSFAQRNSVLSYVRSSVQASFLSSASSSRLELRGSTFEAIGPPADEPGLYVQSDSYVRAGRALRPDQTIVESEITGNVFLSLFSDGTFVTGSPIQGAVSCFDRSRVSTNLVPTGGTTGCE